MNSSKSVKKVQRAQRAGTKRGSGERRAVGFPALIALIIAGGLALVFLAREDFRAAAAESPRANKDHFHQAIAVSVCGTTLPHLTDAAPDTLGIHSHDDGLIHIHPFSNRASGRQAVFERFAEQVGVTIEDEKIAFPASSGLTDLSYANGDECPDPESDTEADQAEADSGSSETTAVTSTTAAPDAADTTAVADAASTPEETTTIPVLETPEDAAGKEARLVMYYWPPQSADDAEPTVYESGFADLSIAEDGGMWLLAFEPEDFTPFQPASKSTLSAPSDLAETPAPADATVGGATDTSTQVVVGDGTTIPVTGDTTVTSAVTETSADTATEALGG